jgi:hypothetical protein
VICFELKMNKNEASFEIYRGIIYNGCDFREVYATHSTRSESLI